MPGCVTDDVMGIEQAISPFFLLGFSSLSADSPMGGGDIRKLGSQDDHRGTFFVVVGRCSGGMEMAGPVSHAYQ